MVNEGKGLIIFETDRALIHGVNQLMLHFLVSILERPVHLGMDLLEFDERLLGYSQIGGNVLLAHSLGRHFLDAT